MIYESKNNITATANKNGPIPAIAGNCQTNLNSIEKFIRVWSGRINSKIIFSSPNEPIFLIKMEQDAYTQRTQYWNVIIGEKIGWIIVHDWMDVRLMLPEIV